MQEAEREEVRELVRQELEARGFSDDPLDDRETIRWVRRQQKAMGNAAAWTWRSFVLAVASGLVVSVWEGIKALVTK